MRSAKAPLSRRPGGRQVRAVTLDCWGTLFLDGPGSDERYRRQRLAGIQTALAGVGIPVSPAALDRAYAATGRWLGSLWKVNRDASVRAHVETLLDAVDPALPDQVSEGTMTALIQAYAGPAVVAPPAIDPGARKALETLAA